VPLPPRRQTRRKPRQLALMDQGAPSVSFTRAKTEPPEGASRLREDERGARYSAADTTSGTSFLLMARVKDETLTLSIWAVSFRLFPWLRNCRAASALDGVIRGPRLPARRRILMYPLPGHTVNV
jgi:hypothetical protein